MKLSWIGFCNFILNDLFFHDILIVLFLLDHTHAGLHCRVGFVDRERGGEVGVEESREMNSHKKGKVVGMVVGSKQTSRKSIDWPNMKVEEGKKVIVRHFISRFS